MSMNDEMLISTIIPTYNTPIEFLKEAIESILSQSYPNWEAIIVDDGSTPENRNELNCYLKETNDERIKLIILDKNYGQSEARNRGIEAAHGQIITFLDADDLHLPWYYQEIVKNFQKNKNAMVLHTHNILYLNLSNIIKAFIKTSYFGPIDNKNNYKDFEPLFPRITAKHEVFEKIKYDSSLTASEDRDLTLQIVNNKDLFKNCVYLASSGYLYRTYSSKTRGRYNLKRIFECRERILNKYKEKNSETKKVIARWQNNYGYFKYHKLLSEYFNSGSLFPFFKGLIKSDYSTKEKIKILNFLTLIVLNKTIVSLFGVDLNYITYLLSSFTRRNHYKDFKKQYQYHIEHTKNNKSSLYFAQNLYKKIF